MRKCKALLLPDPLPLLSEGFEALVVQAELVHDGFPGSVEPEVERRLAVLIAFEPSEHLRRVMRAYAASLIAARPDVVGRVQSLAAVLRRQGSTDSLALVAALHTTPALCAAQLECFRNLLTLNHSGDVDPTLIAVSESPGLWASLAGFRFVRSEPGGMATTSLVSFDLVCSPMAPIYLSPIDDTDVCAKLGSATNPAHLAATTDDDAYAQQVASLRPTSPYRPSETWPPSQGPSISVLAAALGRLAIRKQTRA